ncbi:MAG: hypothetical protein RLZ12_920 [Bacillota bacterium]|jgi:stage II sporulation protein AB (anti-sigma F factor)
MSNFMELKINSCSENEAFARVTVAAFLARIDPTLTELSDVKTIVSEAVTNAIIHGYQECSSGVIELYAGLKERSVTIRIRDYGLGIENIDQAREPLYTSKPELERSGMGFTIMENFTDQLTIDSKPLQGTTITMVKNFEPQCVGATS